MQFVTSSPMILLDFFSGEFQPEDRSEPIVYYKVCIQESGKMPCTVSATGDCFDKLKDADKGCKFHVVGELTQRGKFRVSDFVAPKDL